MTAAIEKQQEFISSYIRENGPIDATHTDFHDAFAEKFGVKQAPKMYGAQPCETAMRRIREMYAARKLKRSTIGLWAMAGMGFPRWVYVYSLSGWWSEILDSTDKDAA